MKLGMKFLSLANEGWKFSFEFLNPRSSIRGTFIPLQCRAISFFFFWLTAPSMPPSKTRSKGWILRLPCSFFLSFFYHIRPRHKRRNTHGEIPNQSRFTRISPLSTFDVETCQNYTEWCMKVASIQILKKSILYTLLFSKFPLNQEDTWNLIFFIHLHSHLIPSNYHRSQKIFLLKIRSQTSFQQGKERLTTREMRKKESVEEATRNASSHTRLVSTHNNARERRRKPREQWRMRVIMPAACVRLHGN